MRPLAIVPRTCRRDLVDDAARSEVAVSATLKLPTLAWTKHEALDREGLQRTAD